MSNMLPRLSNLALLHLHFLMRNQGATDTVRLKDDCPRCQEIRRALETA